MDDHLSGQPQDGLPRDVRRRDDLSLAGMAWPHPEIPRRVLETASRKTFLRLLDDPYDHFVDDPQPVQSRSEWACAARQKLHPLKAALDETACHVQLPREIPHQNHCEHPLA